MLMTQLGESGPDVSVIGFGAWAIGGKDWGKTDDIASMHALHAALDRGVRFIDTADFYGFGHSEKLIAQVLRERGKGEVIVATKAGSDFYNTQKHTKDAPPFKKNFDKAYLIWAAEQSLKRIGFEALDILQLHSPNMEWLRRDEPWEALDKLKQQGKIRHAGWSVQSFQETEQAFILDRVHELLDCIQVRYNLLERNAEAVLFPKAQEYGIGVVVRSPLLYGVLTGKFTESTKFARGDHRRINLPSEKLQESLADMKKLEPLFQAYPNHSKTQVSLAFCASHPACHTVIPGAKTVEQVAENTAAYQLLPIAENKVPRL